MLSRLSKPKSFLLIGIIIISIASGVIYLSHMIDGSKIAGGSLGFIFAIFFSHLIFPEFRKSSSNIWNGNNILGINMKTYFTHPTQIPLMMGGIWFCAVLLAMYVFNLKVTTDDETKIFIGMLIPAFLLFGLSGFLMVYRNEYVNRFGIIVNGLWAKINGIAGILFGWGFSIGIIIMLIFKL